MKGAIHKYLADYFKSIGLSEETLTGKSKMSSIRIQISLKGFNLSDFGPETLDDPTKLEQLKTILANLKLPTAA